jgi:hypothetical protein
VLGTIQAKDFFTYYFGGYGIDTSAKFGGNVRGAIQEVFAVSTPGDCILLDPQVYYLRHQWPLYAGLYGSADVSARTTWLGPDAQAPPPECSAATALGFAADQRFAGWRATPVPELGRAAVFAVYRRDAQ